MEVGQKVYLRPIEMGNVYRRDKSIKESIIEKIGRKYITVKSYGQFEISSGIQKSIYTPDYQMYEYLEEIKLYEEKIQLKKDIQDLIPKYGQWKFSVETLREVKKLLENDRR